MRKSHSSSQHQPRGSSYDDAATVYPHHRSSNRHSRPSRHQPYSSSGSGSGSGSGSDEHDDRGHRSSKHYSSRHHSDYSHQDHSSGRHQHRRGHEPAAAGVGGHAPVSKMSRRYAHLLPNTPPASSLTRHPPIACCIIPGIVHFTLMRTAATRCCTLVPQSYSATSAASLRACEPSTRSGSCRHVGDHKTSFLFAIVLSLEALSCSLRFNAAPGHTASVGICGVSRSRHGVRAPFSLTL
jgi:hypothetical protein